MSATAKQPRERRKRGCLCLFILIAAVLGCLGALLSTGYPQRRITESLLSAALGAQVEVESVSLGRAIEIRKLLGLDEESNRGLFVARRIRITPSWRPWAPRLVERVYVEFPILCISEPGFAGIVGRFQNESVETPELQANSFRLVPKSVGLHQFAIVSHRPELNLELYGIDIETELRDTDSWELRVAGAPARAEWIAGDTGIYSQASGSVNAHIVCKGAEIHAEGKSDIPDLLRLAANAMIHVEEGVTRFDIRLPNLELYQAAIALLPPGYVPMELRFERIDLSSSEISGALEAGLPRIDAAKIHAAANALSAGPLDAPYFTGNVSIEGAGNADALELLATLDAGQQMHVAYSVIDGSGALGFSIEGWTREQVRAAAPAAYRDVIDTFSGVKSVAAEAHLQLNDTLSTDATLTAALASKKQAQLSVRGVYQPDSAAFPFSGSATLAFADGDILLEAESHKDGTPAFDATISNVQLKPWIANFAPQDTPAPLDGALSGSVHMRSALDTWQSRVAVELDRLDFGGAAPLEDVVKLDGDVSVDTALKQAAGQRLDISAGDNFRWTFRDWSLEFQNMRARAKVSGGGDVAQLARIFDLPALGGTIEIDGDATYTGDAVSLHGSLRTADLGYGSFAVPYGQTMKIVFDGGYRAGTPHIRAKGIQVSLGEGNRISGKNVEFDLTALTLKAPEFQCVTDLSPLVAFEYFTEAQGSAEISGALDYGAAGIHGKVKGRCNASRLALGATGTLLEGLDLQAGLTISDTISGSGHVKLDALVVAGIVVSALESGLYAEGASLRTDTVHTRVFDGDLEAELVLGILETGMPLRLVLRPRNADLAVFTEQFKPPDVRLTGRASGKITVEVAGGMLRDLVVDLEAPDGFSMNRDMVEWLLLSQYVQDMPMGQSMDKILRDILGKKEQREFQSAKLTLGFADGRVMGQALLESKSLQLTVDITADPKAITEALRARQRQR